MVANINNGYPVPDDLTDQIWKNLAWLDNFVWFIKDNGNPTNV